MKLSHLKYQRPGQRFRVKNKARFIAILLIGLLFTIAILVISTKIINGNNNGNNSDAVVNPSATTTPTPTYTPAPEPTPTPTPTPFPVPEGKIMEPFLVMIDPGHGGLDGGTWNEKTGVTEKDIVFDIGKRVKRMLDEKGINSMLTREIDEQLVVNNSEKDLVARWSLANEVNASLFVSIHVNAYEKSSSVNGMEIYYFEDKPEVYEGFTQQRFAEIMKDAIAEANGIPFRFFVGNMRLAVVRNTAMPAVLVETAYITGKEDYERLVSDEFRENTARGIVNGIEDAMAEIGVFEHEGDMYVFKEIGE
ncbi:MAG: N-acetylmuramoyl-L-alanine amidase [Clostridiaceae bacterium]|jgi:N-acetylmuramoyl-L-alanine amidase|nr:N-acetylmuramoyl-L-alanine amidase [Clostridiaceae bacterium]